MKPVVPFVDDEQMVLESISRTLHGKLYSIQTAGSGENAVKNAPGDIAIGYSNK